jgi:UDP-glucose 4-epimerase
VGAGGFDPMLQLIHQEDAARAMVEALRPGLRGVYNVVGPGEVPLSAVMRELGGRPSPSAPHRAGRCWERCFRYRLANFPPPELDHIQFLCMVDGSRWTADVGWVPGRSMKDTIRSVDGERAAA